jgi:hypothetical protein
MVLEPKGFVFKSKISASRGPSSILLHWPPPFELLNNPWTVPAYKTLESKESTSKVRTLFSVRPSFIRDQLIPPFALLYKELAFDAPPHRNKESGNLWIRPKPMRSKDKGFHERTRFVYSCPEPVFWNSGNRVLKRCDKLSTFHIFPGNNFPGHFSCT